MSGATSIEWTDATWNPVRGCSRVSEGCRNCYAERQAARFVGAGQYAEGFAQRTKAGPRWTGKVELIPSKLDEPLRWRKPKRIFVNSMSDLFHENLSDEAISAVFGVMAAAPHHTFQVLTKRPERMLEWFNWHEDIAVRNANANSYPLEDLPWVNCMLARVAAMKRVDRAIAMGTAWPLQNVWLGVSVEDQATADERIPLLLQTPAAKRFVSYEPALSQVDFRKWVNGFSLQGPGVAIWTHSPKPPSGPFGEWTRLDWLIVGGESGPNARPLDLAWARSTVEKCKAAGVAVFVKQLGSIPIIYRAEALRVASSGGRIEWDDSGEQTSARLVLRDRKGGDWNEWPEDLRVREFPV